MLPFIFILFLLSALPAYGYIDPGIGTYFLQILFAFMCGSIYLMRRYWKWIVDFFQNLFPSEKKEEQESISTEHSE